MLSEKELIMTLPQIVYAITIFHEYNSMRVGLKANQRQDEEKNGVSEYGRGVNTIIAQGNRIGYLTEWLLGAVLIGACTWFIMPTTYLNLGIWTSLILVGFFVRNALYSISRNYYVHPKVAKLNKKYLYHMDRDVDNYGSK